MDWAAAPGHLRGENMEHKSLSPGGAESARDESSKSLEVECWVMDDKAEAVACWSAGKCEWRL